MKTIVKSLILAFVLSLNTVAIYSTDCEEVQPCMYPPEDIPPTSVPWTCVGPTIVEFDYNGYHCEWCVSYCYRQSTPTGPNYDVYICSFDSSDPLCPPYEDDFWHQGQRDINKFIGEKLISTDPDGVFTGIPPCPQVQETFQLYLVRCVDENGNACGGSNGYCKYVYNACKNGNVNQVSLVRVETIPATNCNLPCTVQGCE